MSINEAKFNEHKARAIAEIKAKLETLYKKLQDNQDENLNEVISILPENLSDIVDDTIIFEDNAEFNNIKSEALEDVKEQLNSIIYLPTVEDGMDFPTIKSTISNIVDTYNNVKSNIDNPLDGYYKSSLSRYLYDNALIFAENDSLYIKYVVPILKDKKTNIEEIFTQESITKYLTDDFNLAEATMSNIKYKVPQEYKDKIAADYIASEKEKNLNVHIKNALSETFSIDPQWIDSDKEIIKKFFTDYLSNLNSLPKIENTNLNESEINEVMDKIKGELTTKINAALNLLEGKTEETKKTITVTFTDSEDFNFVNFNETQIFTEETKDAGISLSKLVLPTSENINILDSTKEFKNIFVLYEDNEVERRVNAEDITNEIIHNDTMIVTLVSEKSS